jgi:hypothetical protein
MPERMLDVWPPDHGRRREQLGVDSWFARPTLQVDPE